jgi:hypothetical protein
LLAQARTELIRLGYSVSESEPLPPTAERREPIGGEVRAERLVGPDPETRGLLYEVILVTASPEPEAGQSRVTVVGRMESVNASGWRRRVPSSSRVRNDAAELFRKLTGQT